MTMITDEKRRQMQRRQDAFRAACDGKVRITEEEKTRWTQFLHATFQAIGPDVMPILDDQYGRERQDGIIEMTLDANHMTMYSDMTPEEEGVLCGFWIRKDRKVMRWLRETLNY